MNHIIGCGGVGSAIVPSLCLLKSPEEITLIDGDRIEPKNLYRQMFQHSQARMNKAEALAVGHGCRFMGEWFARGRIRHHRNDWLICLVDNHRTHLETLEACDESGAQPIFAAPCGRTPGVVWGAASINLALVSKDFWRQRFAGLPLLPGKQTRALPCRAVHAIKNSSTNARRIKR